VRALVLAVGLLLAPLACGAPHAVQFVGDDGSRDWWSIECRGDSAACWAQAKAACHDDFVVHELRSASGAKEPLSASVKGGQLGDVPAGTHVEGKALVITCATPTVPPHAVSGPECRASEPRPNHCDEARGLTFTTGRLYLPPGDAGVVNAAPAVVVADISPELALEELKTIATGLDGEAAAIEASLLAVDNVVRELHDFPGMYRVKPLVVKTLARGVLGGKDAPPPPEMRAEIGTELTTLLDHVRSADQGVRKAPDQASALLAKIATRHARVKTLAAIAAAKANATLASPTATADDKAKADSDLSDVQKLQVDDRKKLDALRAHVTDLSSQIMQALAKLGDATS
jgi:hypothetical protein